jgi:hypothetical protein
MTHRLTSEQCGESARLMDASRIPEARRVPRTGPADASIPPEAGNVWFVDSELMPLNEYSDADEWRPLSAIEKLIVGSLVACVLVPWVVLIAVGVGYMAERLIV